MHSPESNGQTVTFVLLLIAKIREYIRCDFSKNSRLSLSPVANNFVKEGLLIAKIMETIEHETINSIIENP
jgi:hypothetical protein